MKNLLTLLRHGNKFLIVRHGKTDKATPDSERSLTEDGKMLARKAGNWLNEARGDRLYSKVLVSDAKRCYETAEEALGFYSAGIKALYPFAEEAKGVAVLNAQFGKHGNGPLTAYFGEQGCEAAAADYAGAALEEIDQHVPDSDNGDIVVVCHAVVSVMLALEVAKMLDLPQADIETLMTLVLNEGDIIEVSTAGVCHVANTEMPADVAQTQPTASAAV